MTRDLARHGARVMVILMTLAAVVAHAAPGNTGVGSAAQAASAVPTDIHARPVYGPLQAGEISQIRSLGRSVLAAKHSQQPTAEEQALVGELHALSSEINQAILPKEAKVELSTASAPQSRATSDETLRNQLQPHLTRLHERRTALESSTSTSAEPQVREAHQARMRYLSDQVAAIERSVQNALTLPDEERHARLVALGHQLEPRDLGALQREHRQLHAGEPSANAASSAELDQPTPTLTTLTQHRPGPKGTSAGSSLASIPQPVSRPTGKHLTKH